MTGIEINAAMKDVFHFLYFVSMLKTEQQQFFFFNINTFPI